MGHRLLRAICAGCGGADTLHKHGRYQSISCFCPGWQEVRQFVVIMTVVPADQVPTLRSRPTRC